MERARQENVSGGGGRRGRPVEPPPAGESVAVRGAESAVVVVVEPALQGGRGLPGGAARSHVAAQGVLLQPGVRRLEGRRDATRVVADQGVELCGNELLEEGDRRVP